MILNLKEQVGNKAAEYVKSGMIVGLGTGSTVYYLVEALGKRVQEEQLTFTGVTTSYRTKEHAESLGIKIVDIDEVDQIDLTIDGADEVTPEFYGIKGGGAAHLYEKIVAINSNENIWIVDDSKQVDVLGKFPLPVEVVTFGSNRLFSKFEEEGLNPKFRLDDNGDRLKTDDHNYIIDLHLGAITEPHKLASWLSQQVGVIEHGLFLDMTTTVIVGRAEGPLVIKK